MFQTAFQKNAFQNNAFQIVIKPLGGDDGGGWTPEERKRRKQLEKKLRLAEEKRIVAVRLDQESRKQAIRDLVDPVAKKKQSKVQSNQQVSEDTPSEVTKYDALIANLERQKQDLFDAVLIRQAKVRLEQELAVLEAKRKQESDDEEAILLLL